MLGDYSSDIEDRTAAAVRELRETARELEVSRSDYAEMQRAVQLLQVSGKDEVSFLLGNVAVEGPLRVSNEILGKLLVDESQDWVADSNDEVEEVVACLVSHNSCMLQLLLVAQLLGQGLDEGLSN